MKETYYFRHDYNARNDERILQLRADFGLEGYGAYFCLLELMAESSDGYLNRGAIGGLSVALSLPRDRLTAIIDSCIAVGLFKESQDRFFSTRMLGHKAERENFRASGRKGAQARWAKSAPESQDDSHPIGQAGSPHNAEERRVEESREESCKTSEVNDVTRATDGGARKKEKPKPRAETETLYKAIDSLCRQNGLANKVSIRALDVQVERHISKIRLGVEVRKCVTWLIDKGKKDVTTARITNWFEKAREIQKREELRQMERKEAEINPAMAQRRERMKLKEGFDADQSLQDFAASQA